MDMWVHEIDNMKYGLHVKTNRKKRKRKKKRNLQIFCYAKNNLPKIINL